MSEDVHELWLGRAALAAVGALPADEEPLFAAHVAACTRCQEELAELRGVVAALPAREGQLAADRRDFASSPPPELAEQVVWRMRNERRRRRLRTGIAAAAACIALVGFGMAIPSPAGPPQEPIALVLADASVDADAALVTHTWGTELLLEVEGLPAGETYRVTFREQNGEAHDAGAFLGVADRPVVCAMNAAVLRDAATRLEITDESGAVVVAADI